MSTDELRKEFLSLRTSFDKALPKECGNCGSTVDLDIHHIVPLAYGGRNRLSNLARLCVECHSRAHGGLSFVSKGRESRRTNVKAGGRAQGKDPLGLRYENGEYVIIEEEAGVVRLIFRLRYEGELSTINIANVLNHLAIPTAESAKKWTHPVIQRMLDNEIYFGRSTYGDEVFDEVYVRVLDNSVDELRRKFDEKYAGRRVPPRKIRAFTDNVKQTT